MEFLFYRKLSHLVEKHECYIQLIVNFSNLQFYIRKSYMITYQVSSKFIVCIDSTL